MYFQGGIFFSSNDTAFDALQTGLVGLASDTGIDLLVGIDSSIKNTNPEIEIIKLGKLGAFVLFAPHDGQVSKWRQRTVNSKNQHWVSDDVCRQERLLRHDPRVESLICGEIFNARIREGLTARKAAIVIIQGHTAGGFRVFGSMKVLAGKGISSLCSVHADVKSAVKNCYVAGSANCDCKSTREVDIVIGDKPRIEIKFWEIDPMGRFVETY